MTDQRGDEMNLHQSTLKSMNDNIDSNKYAIKRLEGRVDALEKNDIMQDKDIVNLTKSLSKIEENTTWLRRTFTQSLIGGGFTFFITIITGIIIWVITQN